MEREKKVWVYDQEMYPNLFLLAALNIHTLEKVHFALCPYYDDKDFLISWIKNDCDMMIGFNSLQYDYPLLHEMLRKHRMSNDKLVPHLKSKSDRLISTKVPYFNVVKKPFIPQVDLMKIWHYDNKAKIVSLKELEFNMGLENIQSLPYFHNQVLSKSEIDVVIDYCHNDTHATHKFYLETLEAINMRKELSVRYNTDMTNFNDTKIGEFIFIKKIEEQIGEIPKRGFNPINVKDILFDYIEFEQPSFQKLHAWLSNRVLKQTKGVFSEIPFEEMEPLEGLYHKKKKNGKQENLNIVHEGMHFVYGTGGIHGACEPGVFESDEEYVIKTCDVSSLYPNISIRNLLYPSYAGEIFCEIYEGYYNERQTHPKGSVMNLALKLGLVSVFGKSISEYSKLYAPEYGMAITINGQLLMTMLAEKLMKIPNSKLLLINTDGLEIKMPRKHIALYDSICKEWEQLTRLVLEHGTYDKIALKDVNNYIAIDGENIKRKGAAFIYDKSPKELTWNKNHSFLILSKAREAYFVHGTDPEEFIRNHTIFADFYGRVKLTDKKHKLVGRNGEEEIKLEKITRYYVAYDGYDLVKIMPPLARTPDKIRETRINKGFYCMPCNDLRNYDENNFWENLNYDFYIEEAKKVIDKIESNE